MARTTLLSAALIAIALPLSAQDGAGWTPGRNFINNWDNDGDGKVTVEEVLERRGDLFARFDDNKDGELTAEEFAKHDLMRDAMWQTRDGARKDIGQTQGYGRGPGQGRQGPGRGGMSMGGQPGWGSRGGQQIGQPMAGPGYGCGYNMPAAMGMMQPGGYGWGPQGPGMPGYGHGRPGMAPGYGYGPQAMGPGYGQMPQAMAPQGWPGRFGPGNRAQAMQPGFGPGMQGGSRGSGPIGGAGQGRADRGFTMLDTDASGTVSADEFVSAGEDWFARFDGDGDGAVTLEDFGPGRR